MLRTSSLQGASRARVDQRCVIFKNLINTGQSLCHQAPTRFADCAGNTLQGTDEAVVRLITGPLPCASSLRNDEWPASIRRVGCLAIIAT